MAELATIARPYAEALFRAGTADLAAVEGWLDKAATVARDPQLQAFAANPNATNDQVYGLLTGVMGGDPLPSQGANFLRTVIENGRLSVLPEIAEQFRALKNSQGGSADAVIYTAFTLAGGDLDSLRAPLERRFGRKLQLSQRLTPDLIGGVRVVVGDEVLDTSIKARLEQMKVALTA
jgi:F-type H+-transporting ATPase subunit delta